MNIERGQVRVDVGVTAFRGQIDHAASCPSDDPVACAADADLPAYEHHVVVPTARMELGLNIGTGKGWFVWGSLPFDLRHREVTYTLPDGTAYTPPSPELHHQRGSQNGLTDGRLMVFRAGKSDSVSWALGAGTTLPLGTPPEDPYTLGEQGQPHEHLFMGSGTFVPAFTARVGVNGMRWGASVQYDLRYPVYESANGYFPPSVVAWSIGPSWRATPNVTLLGSWESSHQDEERWSGVERGGMHMFGFALGALWSPTPSLNLQARVRYNFAHLPHGEFADEHLQKPLMLTLSGSWTAPAPRSRPEPHRRRTRRARRPEGDAGVDGARHHVDVKRPRRSARARRADGAALPRTRMDADPAVFGGVAPGLAHRMS